MMELINKILIALRLKKPFVWTPLEYELKKLNEAYLKIFKPTIDCINQISKGADYKIALTYTDIKGVTHKQQFKTSVISDEQPGIRFKIKLPNILNVGSVKYKESYGLSEELIIERSGEELFIPENSVIDFETKFPTKPQFLEGKFSRLKSKKQSPTNAYCRLVIPTNDKEMVYPTSILDYKDNHMKFDMSNWDRQMSLIGIPFLSTKGMYSELTIKGVKFHFYALEPINSQVIDSIDKITIELFQQVSYAIRLCFAFLSGKFYKGETILVSSDTSDFSKINYFDYQVEQPSIITGNQIINPTFFFGQYSKKDKETQEQWKEFHNMFDPEIFSSICNKVLDSPELMRSIELIINAGSINDPIQKGALYSVSIETITELLKTENKKVFKPIQESRIWKPFYKDLKTCLNGIKGSISEEGYKTLNSKLANINSPTNREKLEKPFKLVGIDLTQTELESLEQRNSYLHGGQPEDRSWSTMSNLNALKLHYLIGMLILKYFDYSGHYINISGWYILHDRETKNLMEKFDFSELKEIMEKIKSKDFETTEQLDKAKQILENFDKFNMAGLEIEGLIKII